MRLCQHQVFTAAQLVVTKWKVSATKNLFGNGYTMPKRGGGRTAFEGGTHSGGLPTLRTRCLMVSVKDIEDVEGRNALQIVLWQCSLRSMSTRSAPKCLYRCRTGTVVWRVGSGSCPSLGTARPTCVGVAGREELQVVAQAASSIYETALRASGVDGVVTYLSSQQRRKNTLQIGTAASGFLVGWSTDANCMVGGSRVWCGDNSHGTVCQKRSSCSCSPSITASSWENC